MYLSSCIVLVLFANVVKLYPVMAMAAEANAQSSAQHDCFCYWNQPLFSLTLSFDSTNPVSDQHLLHDPQSV